MFVEQIKSSSSLGYGYTRSQIIQLSSEFLSSIGVLKKPKLSQQVRQELKKTEPSSLASVQELKHLIHPKFLATLINSEISLRNMIWQTLQIDCLM